VSQAAGVTQRRTSVSSFVGGGVGVILDPGAEPLQGDRRPDLLGEEPLPRRSSPDPRLTIPGTYDLEPVGADVGDDDAALGQIACAPGAWVVQARVRALQSRSGVVSGDTSAPLIVAAAQAPPSMLPVLGRGRLRLQPSIAARRTPPLHAVTRAASWVGRSGVAAASHTWMSRSSVSITLRIMV